MLKICLVFSYLFYILDPRFGVVLYLNKPRNLLIVDAQLFVF